jgi:hypothetical protein
VHEYRGFTDGQPFGVAEAEATMLILLYLHQHMDVNNIALGWLSPPIPVVYCWWHPNLVQLQQARLVSLAIKISKGTFLSHRVVIQVM